MTSPDRAAPHAALEAPAAVAIVALLGAGVVLCAAGLATAQPALAITGGVTAGIALVLLIAAGWVDSLIPVAVSLPLPAFYSTSDVRVAPVVAVTAACVLGWIVRRGLDGRRIDVAGLPVAPAVTVMGAVMLSAAFAEHKGPALRETFNIALLFAFLAVATDELVGQRRRIHALVWTLTCLLGVSGVAAALQAVGLLPSAFILQGSTFQRATLGFGWPNELGMYMGLGLPFCAYASEIASSWRGRLFARACLGGGVVGLVASFSRGSWLAVVAAMMILLLAGHRRFVGRAVIVALAAALAIEIASGGVISGRITSEFGGSFFDQRAALLLAGLLMFQAHPVLGVGPGGFTVALDDFGPQISWLWDYVGSAHNAFVHMAAETGIVGLIALIVFFAAGVQVLLRGARRIRRDPAADPQLVGLHRTILWSFAIAAAMGMVEWVFAHGVGEFVMLVGAMGFALQCERSP